MSVTPFWQSRYVVEDTLSFNPMSGTLPAWLTDASTGGGSVTVNNGSATLSTGTSASGDEAILAANSVALPGSYDGYAMRMSFDMTLGSFADTKALFGFIDDDSSHSVFHNITANLIDIEENFSKDQRDTRAIDSADQFSPIENTLVFDARHQEYYHSLHSTLAEAILSASTDPTTESNFTPQINLQTQDTSTDRLLNLYEFEIMRISRRD